jgi:hypothetical protein
VRSHLRPTALPAAAALAAASLGVALTAGASDALAQTGRPGTGTAAPGLYDAPVVRLSVIRPFEPPPTPFAAGHRGVDLATQTGQAVLATGAGTVRFAGPVAGRGVVVIAHPDGVLTEYEPVRPAVAAGTVVRLGDVIGHIAGRHGVWPPGSCLHWGARRGGRYFDPLSLLRALGVVRLVPLHGPVPGLDVSARAPPGEVPRWRRPGADPVLRPEDAPGRKSGAGARRTHAYRAEWWQGWHGPAAPGPI